MEFGAYRDNLKDFTTALEWAANWFDLNNSELFGYNNGKYFFNICVQCFFICVDKNSYFAQLARMMCPTCNQFPAQLARIKAHHM